MLQSIHLFVFHMNWHVGQHVDNVTSEGGESGAILDGGP